MIDREIKLTSREIFHFEISGESLKIFLFRKAQIELIQNALENFKLRTYVTRRSGGAYEYELHIAGLTFITTNDHAEYVEKIFENKLDDRCVLRVFDKKEKKKYLGILPNSNDIMIFFELNTD